MIIEFIVLWLMVGAVFASDILHHLTPEERLDIFHTLDEHTYEHEIVLIHSRKMSRQKRSNTLNENTSELKFQLATREKNINLLLKETEESQTGYEVPVFSAKTGTKGAVFQKNNEVKKKMQIYENLEHAASLIVETHPNDEEKKYFTGVIESENLIVRPLPPRLSTIITRSRRSVGGIPKSKTENHNYHVVYTIPKSTESPNNSSGYEVLLGSSIPQYVNSQRRVPIKVYAEIMVVVDDELHKILGNNNDNTIRYILSFWNSVDLRYRLLKFPEIGISIAGIIIAKDHQTLSYLRDHEEWQPARFFDARKALLDSPIFWSNKTDAPLSSYDALFTMTSSQFCHSNDTHCGEIMGLAGVSICEPNSNHAILQDFGQYKSIKAAAHELGHLLGIREHDDACVPAVTNGSFVMRSILSELPSATFWSTCAINQLRDYYFTGDRSCLYNKPRQSKKSTELLLPGMIVTRDQQCRRAFAIPASYPKESILVGCPNKTGCGVLECGWSPQGNCFPSQMQVLDGTPCEDGKGICISTDCIIACHF